MFSRLIAEGMCLLVTITPLAFATDYLLAHFELNAWHGGAYVEWPRLFFCLGLAFACVVLMMVAGIGIPAYQAMRVPPVESLHDE